MKSLKHISTALLIGALSFPAAAATVQNSVFQRTTCGVPSSPVDLDTTNVTIDTNFGSYDGDNCSIFMKGYAGGGVIGILGTGGQIAGPGQPIIESDFDANSVIRDIRVTPKEGYTKEQLLAAFGPTVDIALNASLFASVSANGPAVAGSSSSRSSRAALRAVVEFSGTNERIPTSNGREINLESGYSNITGLKGPETYGDSFQVGLTASWQSPLSVIFRLQGSMDHLGYADTKVNSNVAAFNSLSFSKTGPAFTLPEGFTVNAPELNIFDNQWVDPRIPPTPPAVPLPAGFPLLLAGLGAFAWVRRQQ